MLLNLMNALPLTLRELQAACRQAFTYWLRVLGAGLVLLLVLPQLASIQGMTGGARLFNLINGTIFISIWILGPLLTADCVSRERREETLGLLFLTPLTSVAILSAKAFVHAIRSLTLLFAAIPMLTLCFLIGGVNARDMLRAGLLDLSALALALVLGILASSLGRQWIRVTTLALLLSGLTANFFVNVHAFGYYGGIPQSFVHCWAAATCTIGTVGSNNRAVAWAATCFGFSLGAMTIILLLVAWRLRERSLSDTPSIRETWLLQRFCTPLFLPSLFKRRMSRKLSHNPIGWLQQYSWSARLCKWGWCAGIALYETFVVGPYGGMGHVYSALILVSGTAFSAANSFSRERRNGALELLLVTPLGVDQIIGGRLRGIWGQFFPAFVIWSLGSAFSLRFFENGLAMFMALGLSLLTTGILGLYLSMKPISFLTAWLLTCAANAGFWGFLIIAQGQNQDGLVPEICTYIIFAQLLIGVASWYRLHQSLATRSFGFH